jgi:hypothetical protein
LCNVIGTCKGSGYKLGKSEFRVSNILLGSFREIIQIAFYVVCDEGGSAVKKMQQNGLPDCSTCMKQNLSTMEKILVPYGSVVGGFHCVMKKKI